MQGRQSLLVMGYELLDSALCLAMSGACLLTLFAFEIGVFRVELVAFLKRYAEFNESEQVFHDAGL